MTVDEILDWQYRYSDPGALDTSSEFQKFTAALAILSEICETHDIGADHDVIYMGWDIDFDKVTEERLGELCRLGVYYDQEAESFTKWV